MACLSRFLAAALLAKSFTIFMPIRTVCACARLNARNIYETQMSEGIAIIIGMIIRSMNSVLSLSLTHFFSSACLHLRQILTALNNL